MFACGAKVGKFVSIKRIVCRASAENGGNSITSTTHSLGYKPPDFSQPIKWPKTSHMTKDKIRSD